ncbi:hypothetical protein HA402_014246 [Bradysia odoriphaga]|nr:hypothetical protein HA402_014246 [Bradysia odoriphaga]
MMLKFGVILVIQLVCSYCAVYAYDDGSYHPDNRGQYIPDNRGRYILSNSGQYVPDNRGRYISSNSGQYVPDNRGRYISDNGVGQAIQQFKQNGVLLPLLYKYGYDKPITPFETAKTRSDDCFVFDYYVADGKLERIEARKGCSSLRLESSQYSTYTYLLDDYSVKIKTYNAVKAALDHALEML